MAQYMLVLGGTEDRNHASLSYEEIIQKYIAWSIKLRENGHYVDANKLEDGVGRRLVGRAGRVTDGPYVETKESIGGYYIIEAASLDEAVAIAKECPTVAVQNGFCEVRLVAQT